MMTDYLFLLLAALLLAFDFALSKLYQQHVGTTLSAGFLFNVFSGLFTALIFWAIGGFAFHFSLYSFIMALALSALGMTYTLFGFRILKAGSMALYSLFLMTGGMTVPYLWGLFFLNEPFSWLRTAGLALLFFAVALSNLPKKGDRVNGRLLLMCSAIFLLNGFVSVISKEHQIQTVYPSVSASEFVMLSGIFKALLAGCALAVIRFKKNPLPLPKKSVFKIIVPIVAISATVGGVSYLLQLLGAEKLPATVLYPFITGGSMLFSSIIGAIVFREKLSKNLILSIGLCLIGTLLFL